MLIGIKKFWSQTKVKTSKRSRISKIFHNCALTSRHWGDYQIEKRAYIGESKGEIQITPNKAEIIVFIIHKGVLTVVGSQRCVFILCCNTATLT